MIIMTTITIVKSFFEKKETSQRNVDLKQKSPRMALFSGLKPSIL
ncbi:hypothetical protein PROVALCAL_03917 [Providencia alcalifaciens DSM 30120]|uniref:Uncharacterized protein n=1 Tax=Providencia alcalifaciens DSM 30120 TaxID=520999 RepID=B6XKK7_9GAMM|nr:hypothetical protein PROVALCAL_03917 [Providencia alcalifaciens DSM 30120]